MRWIAVRGIAGAVAGVLVLGVGGRVVMFGSRLIHPDAVGRVTENGNVIGEFTADGTIALLIFGGLLSGLLAGVVWVLLYEWIPHQWPVVGVGAVAIGGFLLIDADNRDFVILDPPHVDLVLLLGLVFTFGAVLSRLDPWLDERLPPARRTWSIIVYAWLVAMASPLLIPTLGSFLSEEFCFCETPPRWTGLFLVAAGAVSLWAWIWDMRRTAGRPARLASVGSVAVAGAVVTGALHLVAQILAIV